MAECLLLALSGQFNHARVCPLLDQSGQRWILTCDDLSANDPKRKWSVHRSSSVPLCSVAES